MLFPNLFDPAGFRGKQKGYPSTGRRPGRYGHPELAAVPETRLAILRFLIPLS